MPKNENTAVATEASPGSGKKFGLQKGKVETVPESDIETKKTKVVDAFDDFLDAIVDRAGVEPEPDGGVDDAAPGGGEAPSSGAPGGGAPTGGTPSGGSPGLGAPASGTLGGGTASTPRGGSESVGGNSPRTESAIREAFESSKSMLREAFHNDKLREAAVTARRVERELRREAGSGGASENAHQSDSNIAPVVAERSFEPSFGSKGATRGVTREKFAIPVNERPRTVPEAGAINIGPPLDAAFGSGGTARERASARLCSILGPQHESSRVLEVIQGEDNRIRVGNTTDYPWRCIASLLITAASGAQYVGTGWLVAPRLLLTAGHCVYMTDEGGWVSQIEVIPGRDANNRPFGSAISSAFRSVTGWTRDENSEYDYGAILLPEDKRFGDQLGWFGYTAANDEHLSNLTANLSGYPGDGGKTGIQGTQWFHSRTLTGSTERQVTYDIDTVGGQSGAPVWEMQQNGGRYGVAIHTHGTSTYNGGTRITREVFDNIVRWAGEVP